MNIVEMLAKNFNIKYAFKVALFVRHRNNKNFKAERVYLDDILQNIPKEKKERKNSKFVFTKNARLWF